MDEGYQHHEKARQWAPRSLMTFDGDAFLSLAFGPDHGPKRPPKGLCVGLFVCHVCLSRVDPVRGAAQRLVSDSRSQRRGLEPSTQRLQ